MHDTDFRNHINLKRLLIISNTMPFTVPNSWYISTHRDIV